MDSLAALLRVNLRAIVRDRILNAILGATIVLMLLVPSISSFSMRQVQELAISLSLSGISFFLLVTALLLGSSAIWRDVEQRYTTSLLTLPLRRSTFVLAKFAAIAIFLLASGAIMGLCSAPLIAWSAAIYPSDQPILWGNLLLAVCGDILKSTVVAAVAVLLSSVSTSFYLPFFSGVVLFLCGSASQEVYEYVGGEFGRQLSPLAVSAIKTVYYVLPNLSAFDFKVHAVYSLPTPGTQLLWSLAYGVMYIAIMLGLSMHAFDKRVLG